MGHYRQYCPVARATEILGERWNVLIVRNLLFGADTFTGIAGGVPYMSRSMLAKRLRELENDGVLTSTRRTNGRGSTYELTAAGRDLADIVDHMGAWADRWVDVADQHTDPGFALWAWCQVQLDRSALPRGRTVVAFEFPDQRQANRYFWLLAEHGDAELCQKDPGGEPSARVVAQSRAFVDWHRGVLSWSTALRSAAITVTGDPRVVRNLPRWNTRGAPIGTPA